MKRRWIPPDDEVAARAWAGLEVVAAASFVATLDAMVLHVAFGSIRRDFPEVSAATLSWILSGYTIVIAAGMIGAGRWADRLGRRRVFLAGMGVTSWRLPRVGSAPRAVERDRHLTVLRRTRSRPSPIVAAEPATTRISRVLQGVPS